MNGPTNAPTGQMLWQSDGLFAGLFGEGSQPTGGCEGEIEAVVVNESNIT